MFLLEKTIAELLASAPNRRARRRRKQIVGLFPALTPILSDFVDVIDEAQPFVDEVAKRLGVKKSVIRCMQHAPQRLDQLLERTRSNIRWLACCLDRTIPEYYPRDEGAWLDFIEAQIAIDEIAKLCGRPPDRLCQLSEGNWADIAAAAAKARDQPFLRLPKPDGLAGQVVDFFRVVLSPEVCCELRLCGIELTQIVVDHVGLLDRETQTEIAHLLYRQRGPLAILRTVSDWIANLGNPLNNPVARARRVSAPLCRMEAWPPLIDCPVVAPNGLLVVPLNSPIALYEEGRAMEHCVGKYPGRLAYYPYHAVSLRTSDGFRLASAILKAEGSEKIEVWDFNGYRNFGLDPRAKFALNWFIAQISNGSSVVDWQRLAAERNTRWAHLGGTDAATDRLQFNFYDPYLREWAWTGFHQTFVSPPYNGLTRDEMMLHTGLRELAVTRAQVISNMELTACKPSPNRLIESWNERM